MQKTKILFVLPNLIAGGAERVTLNIIRQLDIEKFDIYLIVTSIQGEYIEFIPPYVKLINLNKTRTMYSFFSLIKEIKSIKPQIIFSSLNRTNILVLLSKLVYNKSSIIIREPNMPSKELKNLPFFTRFLTKRLYTFADLIIAQTDEMKNEIIKFFTNLDYKKVTTINNPIDKNYINSMLKNQLSPYNYDENIKVLVAIGTLAYRKGFDTLIKVFSSLSKNNENIRLHILGKGEDLNKLQILTKELNINEKVIFEGFQSNPYKYLKYANLFILSSRYEGLPNVVLESLYVDTPVVITDCVPFISNIVRKSKKGEVVDIDNIDQMTKCIENSLVTDYSKFEHYNQDVYDFNELFFKYIMEAKK